MSESLFDAPEQMHPSARITWCGYPAPRGRHPAQDCLLWMGGSVDEPADCRGCVHLQPKKQGQHTLPNTKA
jgi:hypothetical protein